MKLTIKNRYNKSWLIMAMMTILLQQSNAQSFDCDNQTWMLEEGTQRLVNFVINPSNNSVQIVPFINDIEDRFDAIAFNHTDGILYGLNQSTFELFSILPDKSINYITTLNLTAGLEYKALEFSLEGDKLITVGSVNDLDRTLEIIDLTDYSIEVISFTGNIHVTDYCINPLNGILYAYNLLDRNVFTLNLNTLAFKAVAITNPENELQGLFFDSFGTLFGFGSTAFGVASALFQINEDTGREIRLATGPEAYMRDFANCPYRVEARLAVDPKFSFPCNEIEYTCWISNSTGDRQEGLSFELNFPPGFDIVDVEKFGTDADFNNSGSRLNLNDLRLDSKLDSFIVKVEIPDIDAGIYPSSGLISGLPGFLGSELFTDNPNTIRQGDKTNLEIKRIDADSIFVSYFFCRDDEPVLDGNPFGVNLKWETGETSSTIIVSSSGIYKLQAKSGCKTTIVIFDVTIANCPYNIEMNHIIEPDSIYPCSEAIYYFIVDNDTGNTYDDIDFSNRLSEGIEFLEVIKNPYEGDFNVDNDTRMISIENMSIPDGIDTIIILVEVGDIDPGSYANSGLIKNFPIDLGQFRFSDNPQTPDLDSTTLTVLGVDSDSTFVDLIICEGESILLDGSPYGFEYLWDDGSMESKYEIDDIGVYELQIFSGCEVSYVFFNTQPGDEVDVSFAQSEIEIHLGDSLVLSPIVYSENGIEFYKWFDPQDSTISCFDCLTPVVRPFFDNEYTIKVSNEVCNDSAKVKLVVDKTRKIYSPNTFMPGAFGINSKFSLQSPDYGFIEEIIIVDRWGKTVYKDEKFIIGSELNFWDGRYGYSLLDSGVYLWSANITFLDGVTESFSGSLTLLR